MPVPLPHVITGWRCVSIVGRNMVNAMPGPTMFSVVVANGPVFAGSAAGQVPGGPGGGEGGAALPPMAAGGTRLGGWATPPAALGCPGAPAVAVPGTVVPVGGAGLPACAGGGGGLMIGEPVPPAAARVPAAPVTFASVPALAPLPAAPTPLEALVSGKHAASKLSIPTPMNTLRDRSVAKLILPPPTFG